MKRLVFYVSTMQGFSGWLLVTEEQINLFTKDPWKPMLVY